MTSHPAPRLALVVTALLFYGNLPGCRRPDQPPPPRAEAANETSSESPSDTKPDHAERPREVMAAWYDVPADSLAARRGAPGELTAAHNRLPIGTKLRVTHLASGKSVVVRITDHGITGRKMKLDLCKQAAEQLGMVSQGTAKVRMEILPGDSAPGAMAPGG